MKTVWNKDAPLLILHYSSSYQIDPDWPSPKYLFAKYFIPMSRISSYCSLLPILIKIETKIGYYQATSPPDVLLGQAILPWFQIQWNTRPSILRPRPEQPRPSKERQGISSFLESVSYVIDVKSDNSIVAVLSIPEAFNAKDMANTVKPSK